MTKPRILVVDDEENILKLVTAYLEKENYEVLTASSGLAALEIARRMKPDLLVLDVMLPGLDGLEALRELRRESDMYVILLTARAEEVDKIIGLSIGADDYVTKPFSPRELVARIKAGLRRAGQGRTDHKELKFPHIRIDLGARRVWLHDSEIELTQREFDLLAALAEHAGLVLSREQLLENVWGGQYFGELRVVDVHLGHVRQKLGGDFIETVRGVGYRFEDKET
ncbi:MAG: response regulator transcription factor [Anaerolineae bacterium]|nr:MAG: response regulator transcription factor [Anaerolineae bacterium]